MVDSSNYIPKRGDVIWASISPKLGHEQAGRRPALVLSNNEYNGRVGLALICPITRQAKGYPFEVQIPDGHDVNGAILADQVRSIAWRERRAEFICTLPLQVVDQTRATIIKVMTE
jgi:mRNA interferase MazF